MSRPLLDVYKRQILWVGKGRAMKNFEKFFEDVPSDYLSAVIAVAMAINASYNKLVTKHGLYMIGFICSRNLAEMFSVLFVWMKLEGFNNKIKVAKRIGYGYREMCIRDRVKSEWYIIFTHKSYLLVHLLKV